MAYRSDKRRQHKGRKDQSRDKYNDGDGGGGHWRHDEFQEQINDARSAKVEVYNNTVNFFTKAAQFDYVVPRPFCYTIESLEADKRDIKPILADGETMNVFVENADTLVLTKRLIDEGAKMGETMYLNMASKFKPGGGARSGASAQEEELFRRTNYFLHLPADLYELDTGDFIFSRNVITVKDTDYKYLPSRFWSNALAVAALKRPPLHNDGSYKDPRHYEIMYNKIHGMFKIAYLNGQKHLVLGAIGSGAYGHDAYTIASIFREVIKEFNGCFKTVAFAVLCGRDRYNYDTFKEEVENGFKLDT